MSEMPAARALPPPVSLPTVAQALQWTSRPYEFLREAAAKLGDAFTVDLGKSGLFCIFSHPEAVREIFTADPAALHAGKGNEILRPFLGSGSLLLLEESPHQRERKRLVPAFHVKRLEEHGEAVRTAAAKRAATWSAGQEIVIQNEMQEISIDVILRVVFGEAGEATRRDALREDLLAFLNDTKFNLANIGQLRQDFSSMEVWAIFRRRFARIDALVREEVRARREGGRGDPGGILGLMLSSIDASSEGADEQLRDEILTLIVAGYETTATALAWSLYWIHCTDTVRARLPELREELGLDPPAAVLSKHPYLDAICKEVLRIHPVIPVVARQVQRPIALAGFEFPPGVTLTPCVYLAHHREAAFPEPDAFRPERFLAGTPTPYEYFPFGGGARRCIGMGLANLEMKIALGTLLARVEFEPIARAHARPVRRSVTVAPSGGPLMRVRRRVGP